MIELKVQCDCGQKYKFDVEPANGRMPFTVKCPICGLDGTGKANALLQQMPAYQIAPTPAPSATAPQQPRLRISGSANTGSPTAPPPISPASTAPPPIRPVSQQFSAAVATKAASTQANPGNFLLGVAGAIVGGVLGMFIWFFLYKTTGLRLGFLAIGVGALAGCGAKLLGRCHSARMGLVTAVCALACIIGAQYMKAKSMMSFGMNDKSIDEAYTEQVAEAKKVIQAAPNGTDDEIKAYLAKEMAGEGGKPDSGQISAEEIKFFRETTWQKMKDLESGKTTKEQYRQEIQKVEDQVSGNIIVKIIFWVIALGIFNIFSIIIGVGVAYKLGTGET